MQYPSHKELKKCTQEQLQKICAALREDIIASVSENGGHLASSLGAVELCVVLHKYFDLNGNDAVFFDLEIEDVITQPSEELIEKYL